MATQPRNPLVKRMLRAARLDPALYREVAEDETATTEAMLVVVLAGGLMEITTQGKVVVALEGYYLKLYTE